MGRTCSTHARNEKLHTIFVDKCRGQEFLELYLHFPNTLSWSST